MINFFAEHSGLDLLSIVSAFTIALIIAFSIHEFAHAFVAYKLGDNTAKEEGRLTLNPLSHIDPLGFIMLFLLGFGWAKPVPVNKFNFRGNRKLGMFYVAIAGVVLNFVLAFIAYPLYILAFKNMLGSFTDFSIFLERLIGFMFNINIWLFSFNLIPVYPLDGFRVLESVFSENNKTINFLKHNSNILMIVLLVLLFRTDLIGTISYYVSKPIELFWGLFFKNPLI